MLLVAGKVFKRKEEEKPTADNISSEHTEWDEVLQQATEEELVDLAGCIHTHVTFHM